MLPYFNNPALSFSPQCLALFNTPYIFLIYLVYYSFPPQEFSLHKGWNLCLVHCCFLCLENNIVSNIGSVSIHGMNIEYILLSLLCKEKAKFRDTKKKKNPWSYGRHSKFSRLLLKTGNYIARSYHSSKEDTEIHTDGVTTLSQRAVHLIKDWVTIQTLSHVVSKF